MEYNLQFFGGRGSSSEASQNSEWTNSNSGGFTVMTSGQQEREFVQNNMGWYDNLYESSGGFNSKEIQVINKYQNSSQAMNEQLRSDELKPSTKTKVNALTKVLDTSEVETPFVAHRASDGKLLGIDGDVSVEAIKKKVGQKVVDKGFTSTSLTDDNDYDKGSAQYIKKTGGIKSGELVHYHIKTPAGKGTGGLVLGAKWGGPNGQYVGVPEFIFNRGSEFKIVGAYKKKGVVHCNLEYVGNSRK